MCKLAAIYMNDIVYILKSFAVETANETKMKYPSQYLINMLSYFTATTTTSLAT